MYEIWHWPVLLETTIIVGLFMTALICGIKRMERQAERDYPLPTRHEPPAWHPEYERDYPLPARHEPPARHPEHKHDYPLPARHEPPTRHPEHKRVTARLIAERQRQQRNSHQYTS